MRVCIVFTNQWEEQFSEFSVIKRMCARNEVDSVRFLVKRCVVVCKYNAAISTSTYRQKCSVLAIFRRPEHGISLMSHSIPENGQTDFDVGWRTQASYSTSKV